MRAMRLKTLDIIDLPNKHHNNCNKNKRKFVIRNNDTTYMPSMS